MTTATLTAALLNADRGVDEFGELPELKRDAERRSARRGHAVTTWHRRGTHDPAGREAFCDKCGLAVIVSTDPQLGRPNVYGWTLTRRCERREA